MSRYLILYTVNAAIQPEDPKVELKMTEANMAAVDELANAGIVKEHGSFNPGEGYLLAEFPSREEVFTFTQRFWPGIITDAKEITPWETTKAIVLTTLKEQIEQQA